MRGVQGLVLQGPAKAQARAEAQAVGGVHGGGTDTKRGVPAMGNRILQMSGR